MRTYVVIIALLLGLFGAGGVFINTFQSPVKESVENLILPTPTTINPVVKFAKEGEEQTNAEMYRVLQVVDGDTIKIEKDGTKKTIRLIGIDTPETVDPRKPVECFGKEASNKVTELLSGKSVRIEVDESQGDTDRYGRLLRYIFLPDGTNINLILIQERYAYEYTYDLSYKYQQAFKAAQIQAMEKKKGLWGDDVCDTSAQ